MEFNKISEQNAWEAVAAATSQIRRGESEQALLAWFHNQGVNLDQAVFPCLLRYAGDPGSQGNRIFRRPVEPGRWRL